MPRWWRRPRRWRSAPSSPGVGREVHALPGEGRGPAPSAQLGFLPAVLSLLLPAPGRARDRGRAHVHARGAPPGRGLGREGQPRPVGRARRSWLRRHRALPRERVRDGGLRLHARHRLHRRRVSECRGRLPAPLQGRAQPARGREPRHQARLREGVPARRTAGLRRGRAGRAEAVRGLRHAGVRLALRLLPPGARGAGEGVPRGRGRPRVSAAPEPAAVGERALLRAEEAVVLIDRKERTYLRVLRRGRSISVHGAPLACDALIGRAEGSTVETASGEPLLVLRPTYAQLIPSLPRRAQPIYPKDVGPILLWADIGPGAHVVEVGTGPGALTIALLRAVGPTGRLTSYEAREDFAVLARDNVARYHGPAPNWTLRTADAFAGLEERQVDRLVVDLAEPWRLLDAAAVALRPGAVVTAFVPTALQVKQAVDGFRQHGAFGAVESLETLVRFWHVRERSVRPEHRMVAHTGFLVFARRLAPAAGP